MTNLYFIRCNGFVKIGHSADVVARLAELQTGNPYQLQLAAVIPDVTEIVEGYFHAAFLEDRVNGEWFRMSPTLRKVVALVANGARPATPDAIGALKQFTGGAGFGLYKREVFDKGATKVVGLRSRTGTPGATRRN